MKKGIRVTAFLLVLIIVLLNLSNVLEWKNSRENKMPLYKETTDIDVYFVGSSHMRNNVYPMEIWRNNGITSYNIASSGEKISVSYYVLRDMLKVKKPKMIVVDCFLISNKTSDLSMDYGLVHESMDALPLGKNKIELAEYAGKGLGENPLSFLSNIYAYHYRWKELEKRDFDETWNKAKGASIVTGIQTSNPPKIIPESKVGIAEGTGFEYLCKIWDLCKENNIRCLLVNIPYNSSEKRQLRENAYMQEARNRGFETLNFNYVDDTGIDFMTDYIDNGGHMNVLGAEKISCYLGDYLSKECHMPDHREDAAYESWYQDDKEYVESRIEQADEATNALSCLMYAADENLESTIYTLDPKLIQNQKELALFIDKKKIQLDTKLPDDCELAKGQIMVTVTKLGGNEPLLKKFFSLQESSFPLTEE